MPKADPSASFLPWGMRWAGRPLAFLYGLGVKYDRARANPKSSPLATLCIGNMTVGGTGKTPAVIYVARELVNRGRKPAILMRGYKAQGGDEAEEVKTALSGLNVPILLGSDRYTSTVKAKELGCDVALLDDGFQHWRLRRDLDVVLIDATDPFGGNALLPQGKLREPIEGLARAGMIVITRSDSLSETDRVTLHAELQRISNSKPIYFASHTAIGIRRIDIPNEVWTVNQLRGTRAIAACGIGNPNAFERTLKSLGIDVLVFNRFDDHHAFTQNEIDELALSAQKQNASCVIVTQKDAVKIEKLIIPANVAILALRVEFTIENSTEFWNTLTKSLAAASGSCNQDGSQ